MNVLALKNRLLQPLPAEEAHCKMMPPYRGDLMKAAPKTGFKEAAVVVLIVENQVILTKRRPDLKDHAGQISFVGGKREVGESFLETAIREAQEEIGVSLSADAILGALSPLYIPPSNFWVHPFVAYLDKSPNFILQAQEVAQILTIPIADLKTSATKVPWDRAGKQIEMPVYLWEEHVIWGATAMILAEFLEVVG